jgi:hypothetical protein
MFELLSRLHHDERGDAVQFILIGAAVVIPLIIVLVFFGNSIFSYLTGRTNTLGQQTIDQPDINLPTT